MHIFKNYLNEYKKTLLLLILSLFVFSTVFFLNQLPLESIAYAFLLVFFFLFIFLGADFYFYQKKLNLLNHIEENFSLEIENLPLAHSPIEKIYQQIVLDFKEELQKLNTQILTKESSTLDYYTLWAHQIKTPISGLHLLLQTQEHIAFKDDNEQQQYLKDLQEELFKIEQYVEMVLGYQRLSSTSKDLIIKKQPLDPLIRQCIRKYAKFFIRQKLTLDYIPTTLTVLTDEKWFCFLFEQLLSNALKYTYTGKISIYTQNHILYLTDTGIGIKDEDLPRIFEKGYTGYNGRLDKKSTGIGLYLCKQISNQLGHKLSIESKLKQGTTVKLDLSYLNIEVE